MSVFTFVYIMVKRGPDPSLLLLTKPRTYPLVVFDVSSCEHCVIRSFGQLLVVVTVEIFEFFISHVEYLWQLGGAEFGSNIRLVDTPFTCITPTPHFFEEIIRDLIFGQLVAIPQRHYNHYVVAACKITPSVTMLYRSSKCFMFERGKDVSYNLIFL